MRDLEFYRTYLAPLPADGSADYAFRLGYFVHLVCDRIWHKNTLSKINEQKHGNP